MYHFQHINSAQLQRQRSTSFKSAPSPFSSSQLPNCLRSRAPSAPRPVARHASKPQEPYGDEWEGFSTAQGGEAPDECQSLQPADVAMVKQAGASSATTCSFNAVTSVSGIAADIRGDNEQATSSSRLFPKHFPESKGWYECNLFEVLHDAQIDAQAASHFFLQLAMHDSWASPLAMDNLFQAARIADITGFSLPPVIAAHLEQLVQPIGPIAARATTEPLLEAYGGDLPAVLDMLQGMAITPSIVWTDVALRAWLRGGGGAAAAPPLSLASVRAAMTLLEAIYVPAGRSAEPRPPPPQLSHFAAAAAATAEQQPQEDGWKSSASPAAVSAGSAAVPPPPPFLDPAAEEGEDGMRAAAAAAVAGTAACVRTWLDLCIATLLDAGTLLLPHQLENFYGMMPHLATAPSAAVVERLYGEAWPPYSSSYGREFGAASVATAATSPEHIASMLWLVAASGAKLPPAAIDGLLRALEAAVIRIASSGGGGGSGGSGGGGISRRGGGFPSGDAASASATAAAAAALNAAFALPSAPGASGERPPPPPLSPAKSAVSAPPLFPSAAPLPAAATSSFAVPFPPYGGAPPSSRSPFSSSSRHPAGRQVTPYGAYLALWAFHHYRHTPHPAAARVIAPALMSAALTGGGGGGLGPQQRCRVVRAVLMCFGAVPPHLLDMYDWSLLFRGWETLGAAELLPLLQDLAALARQRRRQRRHDRFSGGGGAAAAVAGPQLIRLSHLAAHVVQLDGWQRRLVDVSLGAAIASLSDLLAVLADDAGDEEVGKVGGAAAGGAAARDSGLSSADSDSDDDGSGGAILQSSQFVQQVLSNWLAIALPAVQNRIKELVEAPGSVTAPIRGGVAVGEPRAREPYPPLPPNQSVAGYDVYGMADSAGAACAAPETLQPLGAVAMPAAAAGHRPASWLPPPVMAVTGTAAAAAPPLTAGELMAALTALRDTVAALDPRGQPALHRTLMWAMQRLGARAGRCTVQPEAFASVPDMLVRVDALGWVDVPLEWARSVVQHPDAEGAWFRNLPWPKALRAVLVSGELVQRARADVLRRHGADAAAIVAEDAAAAAAAAAPAPSKAAALLGVAQSLRNHLLGLMAARAAACGGPELRQLALTWQVYGMPYDKEAMAAVVAALTATMAASASAAGGNGGVVDVAVAAMAAAATRGSFRDTAARLEMVCEAQQVPPEEIGRLFAPLRVQGL